MNPDLQPLLRERIDELLFESRVRHLSPEERAELNAILRDNTQARAHATSRLVEDAMLAEELRASQIESLLASNAGGMLGTTQSFDAPSKGPFRQERRPFVAMVAGIVIGLFFASVAWAIVAVPRGVVSVARVPSLVDGSFEGTVGLVPAGFPVNFGVWSGDESEVAEPSQGMQGRGRRALRFIRAEGEANNANSPANSCDVFQLVDLRALRVDPSEEAVLELSADFLDQRSNPGDPVRLGCHIYLFQGDPDAVRSKWPEVLVNALGSGASMTTSLGGTVGAPVWKTVTARCVLPPQAELAVVQLSAGRVLSHGYNQPKLGEVIADDVKLTLKTQPALPTKVVQR